MKHYRRESFDEWRSLHWQIQFFAPRLWRWGFRYRDNTLALPTLSIRRLSPWLTLPR